MIASGSALKTTDWAFRLTNSTATDRVRTDLLAQSATISNAIEVEQTLYGANFVTQTGRIQKRMASQMIKQQRQGHRLNVFVGDASNMD